MREILNLLGWSPLDSRVSPPNHISSIYIARIKTLLKGSDLSSIRTNVMLVLIWSMISYYRLQSQRQIYNNIVGGNSCWAQWFLDLSLSNNFGVEFIVLSTSLNHWLPGSHVLSLLRHLQVLVTMMLLVSTSRQTPAESERCIFESEIISHLDLGPEHVVPTLACFPSPSPCKQKLVPFTESVFWAVYSHPSELEQGPSLKFNGSSNDFLMTQRPVNGWKITLYLTSDKAGPACQEEL